MINKPKNCGCTFCNSIEYNKTMKKNLDGKFRLRQEARLRTRVKRVFDRQKRWIIKNMKRLSFFKDSGKNFVYNENGIKKETNDFLNKMPGKKEMTEDLIDSAEASLLKGGKSAVKVLGLKEFGISFSLANKDAIRYIRLLETLQLSNYKGNIDGVTKGRIKKIIENAAESGASYSETSKLIQQQGLAGVFSKARGELIAVTEIGRAYGKGNHIPVIDFNTEFGDTHKAEKKWQTANDVNVRDTHAANEDDGWIDLEKLHTGTDEEFAPSQDFRCRCVEIYRITPR